MHGSGNNSSCHVTTVQQSIKLVINAGSQINARSLIDAQTDRTHRPILKAHTYTQNHALKHSMRYINCANLTLPSV